MYKYKIVDINGSDFYKEHLEYYKRFVVISTEPKDCGVSLSGTFHLGMPEAKVGSIEIFVTDILLKEIE